MEKRPSHCNRMDSEGLNEGAAIKTENKRKGQAVGREG